jgi:DNA polymerase-3 subunit gamma/tau
MTQINSKYIPFSRKYRPLNFSELMGQEVLVKTLSYCIQNNRLAQAHLLTGIRGVGKTSSARIIAKTVNCTNLQEVDQIIKPCEECKNCQSFNNHNHPDIVEIDAASRTSVDDVREIIESCEYKPLLAARKFFIIDEIHMLSKSAFNALLKIVEEPPEHVIFIFATTEVQKIPLTVISRCQRYDLRRLTFNEIYSLCKKIAEAENIAFEDGALRIIANKSEGSARDALGILDQATSYLHNAGKDEVITGKLVGNMLGLPATEIIIELVQLIIANNPTRAIELLGRIYSNASSLEYFIQALADFIAELCKSKVIITYHNPLYQDYSEELSKILIGTPLARLTILWQIFSNGIQEIKHSHNELITTEMLLIKSIHSCNIPAIEDIMDADASINQQPLKSSSANDKDNIFDFLKFCHQTKEMEVYYLLLNEVEVAEFADGKMDLRINAPKGSFNRIEELLTKWSDKIWKISQSKSNKILTLKEKMIEQVRKTEDYQLIKNNFPEANISDIILKPQNINNRGTNEH